MKIDAHQHFWIYNPVSYAWIGNNMQVLKRNYLPEDLQNELEKNGFSGSVAVQARQLEEETRWLLELSEKNSFIIGVVGWVDLCNKEKLLKQLDEFCKFSKFVGVRHVVQDEPDENFMLRNDFLEGLQCLKDYNLTYDLLLFPKHLPVAQKVVAMFPNQKFVLDHISKPSIKEHILSPWKEEIIKLAGFKNVWCKLSGMVTEADWQHWKPEDIHPYLEIVFKVFGTDRLMIGSDWPVCRLAGEYKAVMDVVMEYIQNRTLDEQNKILGMNCLRFYNIMTTIS